MAEETVGFIGLGNMGALLATNLVGAGYDVVAHDADASRPAPQGSTSVGVVADVARQAGVIVLSLPDGRASEEVSRQIVRCDDRRSTHVIDTSTIGVATAGTVSAHLMSAGLGYVDAPVSGGLAGARARTPW